MIDARTMSGLRCRSRNEYRDSVVEIWWWRGTFNNRQVCLEESSYAQSSDYNSCSLAVPSDSGALRGKNRPQVFEGRRRDPNHDDDMAAQMLHRSGTDRPLARKDPTRQGIGRRHIRSQYTIRCIDHNSPSQSATLGRPCSKKPHIPPANCAPLVLARCHAQVAPLVCGNTAMDEILKSVGKSGLGPHPQQGRIKQPGVGRHPHNCGGKVWPVAP